MSPRTIGLSDSLCRYLFQMGLREPDALRGGESGGVALRCWSEVCDLKAIFDKNVWRYHFEAARKTAAKFIA